MLGSRVHAFTRYFRVNITPYSSHKPWSKKSVVNSSGFDAIPSYPNYFYPYYFWQNSKSQVNTCSRTKRLSCILVKGRVRFTVGGLAPAIFFIFFISFLLGANCIISYIKHRANSKRRKSSIRLLFRPQCLFLEKKSFPSTINTKEMAFTAQKRQNQIQKALHKNCGVKNRYKNYLKYLKIN